MDGSREDEYQRRADGDSWQISPSLIWPLSLIWKLSHAIVLVMEIFPSLCSLLGSPFYFYPFLLMTFIYSTAERLQTCTNMVHALVRAQRVDSIYSCSLLLSSPQFCNQL